MRWRWDEPRRSGDPKLSTVGLDKVVVGVGVATGVLLRLDFVVLLFVVEEELRLSSDARADRSIWTKMDNLN